MPNCFPVTVNHTLQLRWLKQRLQASFRKAGLEFEVEYVTNVRNWTDSMAKYSTLSGAYRKRKMDDFTEIPHSFVFVRRDCGSVKLGALCLGICFLQVFLCFVSEYISISKFKTLNPPEVCLPICSKRLATRSHPDLVASRRMMCF